MQRATFLRGLAGLALATGLPLARADDNVLIIANQPIKGLDLDLLKRIYSGRVVELDGLPLRPINLPAGHPLRRRFLASVMQQEDDDYVAYWTVRRYIGKGTPPREVRSVAEVIEQVQRTPGAIGYIETADLRPGLNVLMRR